MSRGTSNRNASRKDAFTLVEVIVAMAILALVSTTVAVVMGVGVEAWRAAAVLGETGHDGEAVLEQVAMALRSAAYPSDGELSWDFGFQHEDGGDGDDAQDAILWTKTGTALIGEDVSWAGSSHRVRLFVDDKGDDGPGLYAKAWQLVGQPEDFDPDEDAIPVLLSDQVTGLDVRMLDPEKALEPGEPYEWIDEWQASNRIPRRILVTMLLKPQKKKAEAQQLVRMVEIPMSEASWSPSKVDADGKSSDKEGTRNGRGGGAEGGADGGAAADGTNAGGGRGQSRRTIGGGESGGGIGSGGIGSGAGTRINRIGTPHRGSGSGGGGGNSGSGNSGGGGGRSLRIGGAGMRP